MSHCFGSADLLLPRFAKNPAAMQKWATIACDQYTSQPSYWKEVEQIVGDAPSTLSLVLPEIYLAETKERMAKNQPAIRKITSEELVCRKGSMILVKRRLKNGSIRTGFVGKLDLEAYGFEKGSQTLVRATEETVSARIPPRIAVRESAPVEVPHVMVFYDDPTNSVINSLPSAENGMPVAYDFDLMQKAGHVTGCFLSPKEITTVEEKLEALLSSRDHPMLFAVGDGNHSLATAKTCWENLKKKLSEEELAHHPARYALVELVNLHDPAIVFEPIYRVLFHVDPADVEKAFAEYLSAHPGCHGSQSFTLVTQKEEKTLTVPSAPATIPVGTLQPFLDAYLAEHPSASIDYIHGIEATKEIANRDSAIGFLFGGMKKEDLFPAVLADGALPRKTFSMGEADDKRFYLEARAIR